jgi:hypothetical protein
MEPRPLDAAPLTRRGLIASGTQAPGPVALSHLPGGDVGVMLARKIGGAQRRSNRVERHHLRSQFQQLLGKLGNPVCPDGQVLSMHWDLVKQTDKYSHLGTKVNPYVQFVTSSRCAG